MNQTQTNVSPIVRISRGNFDPARFEEVKQMVDDSGKYLIPAIKQLPGLITYYVGCSPDGSIVHVSIWDSEEHAKQMGNLKEMTIKARQAAESVGVTFTPISNYPTSWSIVT